MTWEVQALVSTERISYTGALDCVVTFAPSATEMAAAYMGAKVRRRGAGFQGSAAAAEPE